jgi:hypothetical protein
MASTIDRDDAADIGRFEPGTHIQVRRFGIYMHHGIYVSDDRVIQFGGGDIWNKREATICVATLAKFEADGVAVAVVHGGKRTGLMPPLPEALHGSGVIKRAEWLLQMYMPGRYHLIGNNCESAANWCTTGHYSESHQARAAFGIHAITMLPFFALIGGRKCNDQRLLSWATVVMLVYAAVGVLCVRSYNAHIRRFWEDIGSQWAEFERSGGQVPEVGT